MYILNNAIKNLLRNKLCNSFSTVVILLMVLAILISSIINSNVNVIKANYEKKFESEVQIKLDAKKIVQSDSGESLIKYSNLSVNDYLNFAKSKYVKKVSFIGNITAHFDNKKYNSNDDRQILYDDMRAENCGIMGYTEKNESLKHYNLEKVKGRLFQKDNECMVSEEFIDINKLKIGDTISLLSDYSTNTKLNLKIVGTYKKKDNKNVNDIEIAQDESIYDNILTTYNTLVEFEKKIESENSIIYTNARFLLIDSNSRKDFEKEVRDKGLSDIYKVTIDEFAYSKLITPMQHLSNIAFTVTLGILILGSILLMINSIISIKKIKYYISVLILTGMPKFKIVQSFICESIMITLVCLILGGGIVSISASKLSNYVFEYQNQYNVIHNVDLLNNREYKNIDINSDDIKQEIKSLRDKLIPNLIFKIIIVAIILILLTNIVAIYSTIVYKPIQIIYDRN
ncbi:FtsX-like permease family protein [Clostridioides sp. ES-S-0005-03]|uniref:FtsX-like permease family protein n=1 Tax=Clostridioides sp. ES-S-0005-03 TaxID=2770774 RepID=UPI001D113BDF|nr:FtsX-like permease family protein [Clostridioides sp. ES-S-0005-03]UDN46937.1 FtsX-like permease family protein [Clostridioides sp. ES-S-0173-01]